ncbi:3'(2'),5'-bisphosphate nucleotidase [Buchnera aphidicola (Hyadaphis tataricae)]|uniref:3'(2'),5'-bisphosphate nucleotidase CysQ n=1 Tax=Buchnera aphidicola (Hyadaphis tataricae) TaxID=1241859 RepID=A0A4D6XZK5_9GAMM|nr:3'(2'),5'-bisphosphate nucleotidase CysQ [Buchnera aphidicola]QCI21893.1 3'(2'),5'-bisphosphate nucleotidase [Buchnera aphidicola (Hyadaphis tataricae)]
MLEKVKSLARYAGSIIMNLYNSQESMNIYYKSDNTPVTHVDYKINDIIKEGLLKINPTMPIISEEESYTLNNCYAWKDYWLIDPLDGTKEFLNKNGEFTVNISLIKNGCPILGVIYAPCFDILYSAFEKSAWKEVKSRSFKEKIHTFSSNHHIPVLVTSRSHPDQELPNYLKNIKQYHIKKIGSSLKFCLIAEGSAQIYPRFGNTYIWDTAAGQAIVTASGGKMTTWKGESLNYSLSSRSNFLNPGFIVVSS